MDWKLYGEELLSVLQEQSKELWKGEEDTEFLKYIAINISEQTKKIIDDPDNKNEHITNLRHLQVQVYGRIADKKNQLITSGDIILQKVVDTAVGIILTLIGKIKV